MQIKIKNELLALNLLVIVLITAIIFFPSSVGRIILGLPFVLFFPGYVLMAALFPKKEGISGIQRLALSFGMSIAVVPLIGLILHCTTWGIRLESILYSMALFMFVISAITWLRWRRLPKSERFSIEFQLRIPIWRGSVWGGNVWNKVLSVVLVLAILGAAGMLGYVLAMPKMGERFTEFYILGSSGKAIEYPGELKLGEEEKVTVGIINQEHETMSYRVDVRIDGVRNSEIEHIVLEQGEKWEETVSFVPEVAGENQKVEFLLYKNMEVKPCLEPLHLWVSVKHPE